MMCLCEDVGEYWCMGREEINTGPMVQWLAPWTLNPIIRVQISVGPFLSTNQSLSYFMAYEVSPNNQREGVSLFRWIFTSYYFILVLFIYDTIQSFSKNVVLMFVLLIQPINQFKYRNNFQGMCFLKEFWLLPKMIPHQQMQSNNFFKIASYSNSYCLIQDRKQSIVVTFVDSTNLNRRQKNVDCLLTHPIELIIVIMQQTEEKEFSCENCFKKQRLIEKYLNLIDLLKKKSDKSLMSTTLRRSTDAPNDHSNPNPNPNLHRATLPYALLALAQRRTSYALLQLQQIHLEAKCHKGYLFVQTVQKLLNRRVLQTARKLFQEGGASAIREVLEARTDRSVSRNQSCCSASAYLQGEKRDKVKALTRRLFEVTQEVNALRVQKRSYDEQIEQNLRRQQVQSKKKKESLEMLAQEMAEKNDIISELQATIKFYEHRQGRIDNNILEEDGLSLKRDLEQLEKLNEKLSLELERKGEQLQRSDQELSKVKERMGKLEGQLTQLKERNFQLGIQMQDLQKKRKEYAALNIFLQKKLTSLKKYERLITANLRAIQQASLSDRSSFNTSLWPKHSRPVLDEPQSENNLEEREKEFAPISKFQAQYKVEKILNYLYNIDLDDVWISNEEKLFDQQELNVLNELKIKFIQLKTKPNLNGNLNQNGTPNHKAQPADPIPPPARLSKQCEQSDQIYFNQQHVSGSIFEVFGSEKVSKGQREVGQAVSEWGRRGQSGGEQGFTIKLLQMQIEKNKQVEKISQLKNKLFHIRSIVMNLIKSLDFKNLRPQCKDIIDVCFQFFEYSQEEKQIIFHSQTKKEKRFLGFF